MGDREDQQLVRAARAGDAAAFARLVADHYPLLLSSCERMLSSRDLARDAAQEATLRAMLGLDQLRDDTRFGAWLVGIGLNVCRGLFAAGRRQVSLEALRESGRLAEPVADDHDPVARLVAGELAERVRGAIGALPAGQRAAVALFYIAGLTQAEAAAELGTRPGAVKTRLHKARGSLRAALTDTYREFIDMSESSAPFTEVRIVGLRRLAAAEPGIEQHVVVLADDEGRRLPIWIGMPEATAMALVLEQVQLPRPGAYQFTAALLAGAGTQLREVRITELTGSVFYARAVLSNGTAVDARPSDALTLALVTGCPIHVADGLLETTASEPLDAGDDASVIAQEAHAHYLERARGLAGEGDVRPSA